MVRIGAGRSTKPRKGREWEETHTTPTLTENVATAAEGSEGLGIASNRGEVGGRESFNQASSS